MNNVLSFKIAGLPKTTNASRRHGHWGALLSESRKWKRAVWAAVQIAGKPTQPMRSARIELIRHSSTEPDFDNLVSSFKWILDGLIDSGVIVSDKPSVIGQPGYQWKKAAPKYGFIEVKVSDGKIIT